MELPAGFGECIRQIQEDNAGSVHLGLAEMAAAGPQSHAGQRPSLARPTLERGSHKTR
jgi:hypothetical protein